MSRIIRLYQPGNYQQNSDVLLDNLATHHCLNVLRLRCHDTVWLFNGCEEKEYQGTIVSIQKKAVTVHLSTEHHTKRESPLAIHLAQGIAKGERMSFIIQKAVELGVKSITPLITTHGTVRLEPAKQSARIAQWQTIATHACEQSGRCIVPVIHPIVSLQDYLKQTLPALRLLLHPAQGLHWSQIPRDKQEVALMIGAEGGFAIDEREQALAMQFLPIQLGPRVLRTETATLAALSMLQMLAGDW